MGAGVKWQFSFLKVLRENAWCRGRRGTNTGLLQLLWTVACSALTWPV